VAVKKLKNASISHRFFLREVSMLWRARHRSVVMILGATASPPAVVTAYLSGGSLYDALHVRKVRIDIQLALSMYLLLLFVFAFVLCGCGGDKCLL
jgi:hypothetical protein